MSVNEIIQLLNIPHSTFNDWSKEGHSKYELSLLLQGLDSNNAQSILENQKKKLQDISKYKESTRKVILDKSWFSVDLFWTTANKTKIDVKNIITVYMNRANQIDTDKLCQLFGYDRVKKITNKNISDEKNQYEALRQLCYYYSKHHDIPFNYKDELHHDYFSNPTQRVVDYYCNKKGYQSLLDELDGLSISLHKKMTIKKMITYYKKGLDDRTIKNCA